MLSICWKHDQLGTLSSLLEDETSAGAQSGLSEDEISAATTMIDVVQGVSEGRMAFLLKGEVFGDLRMLAYDIRKKNMVSCTMQQDEGACHFALWPPSGVITIEIMPCHKPVHAQFPCAQCGA